MLGAAQCGRECLPHARGHARSDVRAGGRRARLPGEPERPGRDNRGGRLRVGVVEHEHGVLPAHLELHPSPAPVQDALEVQAHGRGPGEGQTGHALVAGQRLAHHPATAVDHVEHPVRQPRVREGPVTRSLQDGLVGVPKNLNGSFSSSLMAP